MEDIQKLIGRDTMTVSEAMKEINENDRGILFLTDQEGKLCGSITDGDIRRFLLKGGKLDEGVMAAANRNPKTAHSLKQAAKLFHNRDYVVIPVVDPQGIIIDLYSQDGRTLPVRPNLNIPVVINAGGRGTRLDPYTRVLPKPLIPVGDIPIIELIMKEYQTYHCNDFHIIVNYKKELMKAYFLDRDKDYNITWHDEEEPLGTGGGLSLLKGQLHETFFFTNCDSLMTADYEEMIAFHRQNRNLITMVCARRDMVVPYGIVEMGENGSILEMKEKPTISFFTNSGFYIVEPEVIDEIDDNTSIGFPEIIEQQRKKGKRVAVYPVAENDWMDMGQISELEKMRSRLYGSKQSL